MIEAGFEFIFSPLAYPFMQRALIVALMTAVACAIFSCFLILKGWSLMGDAISHAILPGVAIAVWIGIPISIGALFAGLLCALGAGYLNDKSYIKADALLGIVFSTMFALGVLIYTKIESDTHILHLLFGNILGTEQSDLWEVGIIVVFCVLLMLFRKKELIIYCFDQNYAVTLGLPVKALHLMLLVLLSLVIVAALKVVGVILVISMLVTPGAIGFLLSKSFNKMLLIAVLVAVSASFGGVVFSYHLDVETAPLITLIQTLLFVLAFLYKKIENKIGQLRAYKMNRG